MERVLEVEQGTFTPLVMGTNRGMEEECSQFLSQLATNWHPNKMSHTPQ